MKRRFLLALVLIFIGFACLAPIGISLNSESVAPVNYERAYTFNVEQRSSHATYTLYTSVPPSLYDYYRGKANSVNSDREYSKFVTPEPVQTLADNIRNITGNKSGSDEEFANNVLMLVHQIPYAVSNIRYPVEVLVENSGDCDVLSFLAASIMKAGGLDVVLLVYRDLHPSHMNIGVYLPYAPVCDELEAGTTGFEYNNKTYWVSECTPSGNWRVGNQPDCFASSVPVVIPIETQKNLSSGRVSSSLNTPLIPSSISVNMSLENINDENEWALVISGSISPSRSGEDVMLYVSHDGGYSYAILQIATDKFGKYSIPCNVPSSGTYTVRTSLIGFSNYAGSDSETVTVFVRSYPPGAMENVPAVQQSNESNAVFAFDENAGYQLASRNNAFLKSRLTGGNISLSGEFLILNTGQNSTDGGQTITLPETKQTIIRYRRRSFVITIPERIIKLKELENNQFGFILENYDGNYSASVKLLDGADVSNIENRLDGSNATFMNVSKSIVRNVWYKAVAKIAGDEITTELRSENDTLLETSVVKSNTIELSKFGILISCDPTTFIAFKNLKVENLDQQPDNLVSSLHLPENELKLSAPYFVTVVLLVVAGFAIYFLRKNKKSQSPSKTQ